MDQEKSEYRGRETQGSILCDLLQKKSKKVRSLSTQVRRIDPFAFEIFTLFSISLGRFNQHL